MDIHFRQIWIRLAVSFAVLFLYSEIWAEDTIIVKIGENQNIRDISKDYLDDPNLWDYILRVNGLKSPHEVVPGVILRIPVAVVKNARAEIKAAEKLIQEATEAGANLFASEDISEAVRLKDDALKKQESYEWEACALSAKAAAEKAKIALSNSKKQHNIQAEAAVKFLQGQVQKRKPADNMWNEVELNDVLVEGERIRTLSQSRADILFRDESRLQLKENAQALIRKMRSNRLEDSQEATVSLIEGDVFALLTGGRKDKGVKLDVPGLETKFDSQQFWVGRDKDSTRIANYDKGEVEIAAAGERIVLKKNQGSVVHQNQKPSPVIDLLPSPSLKEPKDGDEVFEAAAFLKWEAVDRASAYMIEIARSSSFSTVIWSDTIKELTTAFPKPLGAGIFFWRVSAVSDDKIPGPPSTPRRIRIMDDGTPPFLAIQSPIDGEVFTEDNIEIAGITEEGVNLTVLDKPIQLEAGGKFKLSHSLKKGENSIVFRVVDPAGNTTEVRRTVMFFTEGEIFLSFDPSLPVIKSTVEKQGESEVLRFVASHRGFTLSGKTVPGCSVMVKNKAFSAKSSADKNGQFQINIQLADKKNEFTIDLISKTGKTLQERFFVEIDDTPPSIRFTGEIPSPTKEPEITVTGILEDGITLDLNGEQVLMENSGFSKKVKLSPGINLLNFSARDLVGNVAAVKKEIVFDPDAPELVSYAVSPQKAQGGEQGSLTIMAKDATGLVKAVPFTVQVGERLISGVVKLSDSNGKYIGSFRVPEGAKGMVKLTKVSLSDYLGNRKEYEIGN